MSGRHSCSVLRSLDAVDRLRKRERQRQVHLLGQRAAWHRKISVISNDRRDVRLSEASGSQFLLFAARYRAAHYPSLLPTIATQSLFSIPAIRPVILAALERDCMIPSKVLREQMQKLLLEPLSSGLEHPRSSFLVVVDALDECDDPRLVVELLSLLIQLVRSSPLPLRLLITSRPEPWLQAHFRQPDFAPATLTLEIESFNVEDDIRSFLQHALNQVYGEHSQVMPKGPWPSPDRIVEKASGLFIFALTVVKFVGDRFHNPVQRLEAILDDKRSGDTAYADLDAIYLDAVSTFPDADLVRLILGVVYCLSVPMTVPALHHLLDRPDVDARIVIPALSSVLLSSENGEQPVRFIIDPWLSFVSRPWSGHWSATCVASMIQI